MTTTPDPFENPRDASPAFRARFSGECACGVEFDEGALVRYVGGELTAEECCGEDKE